MRGSLTALRARSGRFTAVVQRARRDQGIVRALVVASGLVIGFTATRLAAAREALAERRLGIRTGGETRLAAATTAAAAHNDAVDYQATPAAAVRRLLRSLPIASPAEYTFVDLGCGKGRILVLAAMHGFRRVVGVELDRDLLGEAERNVRSWQARTRGAASIDLVHGDAAGYRFPPTPVIVYLHNPFGKQTMEDVVRKIEDSLRERPRPFLVAYYNPVQRQVLAASSLLTEVPSGSDGWSFYAAPDMPAG